MDKRIPTPGQLAGLSREAIEDLRRYAAQFMGQESCNLLPENIVRLCDAALSSARSETGEIAHLELEVARARSERDYWKASYEAVTAQTALLRDYAAAYPFGNLGDRYRALGIEALPSAGEPILDHGAYQVELPSAAPQEPVDTNSGCRDQGRAPEVAPAVAALSPDKHGEPVAWRYATPHGWVVTKAKHMDSEPLYAHQSATLEWITVTDTSPMPDLGITVLFFDSDRVTHKGCRQVVNKAEAWIADDDVDAMPVLGVVAWMPLPRYVSKP